MVLYHIVTTYHLLKSMIHASKYHKNEDTILLVPSFFPKKPKGLNPQSSDSFFTRIIEYDWEYKKYDSYPQDVFSYIEQKMKSEIGDDWTLEISEFNVFNAARFFGSFLSFKGIHFNWHEEADGRFSEPYPVMKDDERLYKERFLLANSFGLYKADNVCIDKIFLNVSANPSINITDFMYDFNCIEELDKLKYEDLCKILDFWGVSANSISVKSNSALLMTQHFCNIKLMSFEEQALMYQILIDYFVPEKHIYIKLHPSDWFPYYEYIDNLIYLEADYPSELLHYAIDGKFDRVGSVSSTGIMNLSRDSKEVFMINQDFIYDFVDTDLYYFASSLSELFNGYYFSACGLNDSLLKTMFHVENFSNEYVEYSELNNYLNTKKVLLLGTKFNTYTFEEISNQIENGAICVFLNTKGYEEEYKIIKKYLVSVKISNIYSLQDKRLLCSKPIYICSESNTEIIERLNHMSYEKILEKSGLVVNVQANDDKDYQISMLRGMLQETEKRLEEVTAENRIKKMENK